ncbi:MAG: extracellular solute-binding protein [Clostridiales bacterium]|nr:extracellular solute-binding protein [Clostridiales bacterium]
MKKILALILSMAMVLSLLTACGSSSSSSTSDSSTTTDSSAASDSDDDSGDSFVMDEPEGEYTDLTVWTFNELHQEFYIDMAEKWNEENPDKQVRLTLMNMDYDAMHNKLSIALESGTGAPDVVDIEIGKFPSFINGASIDLYDLSDAIEPYLDEIVETRLDIYSKDGSVYGYPTHVGTTVAFYNVELLEEAGIDYESIETWDDWKEAGVAYYEATGKQFSNLETTAQWVVNLMLVQKGGSYLDEDGNPNLTSDELTEVLNFLVECQDTGAFSPMPGGQPDSDEAYASFNQGDYACQIMPFWQTSRFTNYMTDLSGKVAIATVPRLSTSDTTPWTIGGGGTGTAIVASSENAELAAEVFAYIKLSSEASVEIWSVLGFDPVNTAIWTDTEITENPDNAFVQYFVNSPFYALNEMADSIGALSDQTSAYWSDITNEISTVTLEEIFENGTSVEDALESSQDTVMTYVS